MAFITLTEDEAVYCLAAIGRVTHSPETPVGIDSMKLCEKLGANMTIGELHASERLYQKLRFSKQGDPSVNFVECYWSNDDA